MASYKDTDPSGIYQFKNIINGHLYVGYSNHLEYRRRQHLKDLRAGTHCNPYLQAAFRLYGESAFEWSVIEYCPVEQLKDREKYWIATLGSFGGGYNLTEGGDGSSGAQWKESQYKLMCKPVVCLNTMQKYKSITEAANLNNGSNDSVITKVCTGRAVYSGTENGERLVWRYASDAENMTPSEIAAIVAEAQTFTPKQHTTAVVALPSCEYFPSETDAAKFYGIKVTAVNGILKGRNFYAVTPTNERITFCLASVFDSLTADEVSALLDRMLSHAPESRTNGRERAVIAFPTMRIYSTLTEASKDIGVRNSTISTSCSSPIEHKKRARLKDGTWSVWAYYDDYIAMSKCSIELLIKQSQRDRTHAPTNTRAVRLVNTGEVFNTIKDASVSYRVDASLIGGNCRGKYSFGGHDVMGNKLYWEYVA